MTIIHQACFRAGPANVCAEPPSSGRPSHVTSLRTDPADRRPGERPDFRNTCNFLENKELGATIPQVIGECSIRGMRIGRSGMLIALTPIESLGGGCVVNVGRDQFLSPARTLRDQRARQSLIVCAHLSRQPLIAQTATPAPSFARCLWWPEACAPVLKQPASSRGR